MAFSAKDVKNLRDMTGAGMMDAKKALTEVAGDMEAAIDWLRTKGLAKADKKAPVQPEPVADDPAGDVEDEDDNCATGLLEATYEDEVADGPCDGSKVITRTWTLDDGCGNITTDVQTITVEDNTKPRFNQPTPDVTLYTEEGADCPNVEDIISLARALSFNGLANAQWIAAINGGAHTAPCFAGDAVYAWSEVLDKAATPVASVGALRLRLVAVKNRPAAGFPLKGEDGRYAEGVVLDFDYTVLMPRSS